MKISDVIKTPVEVKSSSIFGHSIRNSGGEVALCGLSDQATAIAHAINSHDKLVDLVGRMRETMIEMKEQSSWGPDYFKFVDMLLKESEGIE